MINLDTLAQFIYGFGQDFLLEVKTENADVVYYVWNDPDYGGNNTIRPYYGKPEDFTSPGFCGRDKGNHIVRNYCGENVIFIK